MSFERGLPTSELIVPHYVIACHIEKSRDGMDEMDEVQNHITALVGGILLL
jgi:hypothetical protein